MKPVARRSLSKDGMLLVYKPGGMTSKDVSRWIQQRFGKVKMGHVGTLDPLAEGLLPILFGKATRLQDYLLAGKKSYEFEVGFGRATDTLDADGSVVAEAPCDHLERTQLERICAELVGDFVQVPPMYSAIKFQGKPLYEYARQGQTERVPLQLLRRTVRIDSLLCLDYAKGVGRFRMDCSKGTYVRVVATQIAERAATLGTVTRLLRLSSGSLRSSDAWTLEQLEAKLDQFDECIVPIHSIQLDIPRWTCQLPHLVERLRMGQEMQVEMKMYEGGLAQEGERRATIRSLDHVVLIDNNGGSFGIGSATVLNTGRVALRMRRGLS